MRNQATLLPSEWLVSATSTKHTIMPQLHASLVSPCNHASFTEKTTREEEKPRRVVAMHKPGSDEIG